MLCPSLGNTVGKVKAEKCGVGGLRGGGAPASPAHPLCPCFPPHATPREVEQAPLPPPFTLSVSCRGPGKAGWASPIFWVPSCPSGHGLGGGCSLKGPRSCLMDLEPWEDRDTVSKCSSHRQLGQPLPQFPFSCGHTIPFVESFSSCRRSALSRQWISRNPLTFCHQEFSDSLAQR